MTVPPGPKRLDTATYSWVNEAYEITWVKYHFKAEQGVEFLTQAEGDEMTAIDGDAHQRDLYTAIEEGDHPSGTLKVHLMPFEDATTYRFNPFDLTKVWHGDYPLHEVVLEGVTEPILQRAFEYWRNVDKDQGERIEQGVRAGQSSPCCRSADAKGAHVSPRRLLLHDPAQRRTKCGEPFGGS